MTGSRRSTSRDVYVYSNGGLGLVPGPFAFVMSLSKRAVRSRSWLAGEAHRGRETNLYRLADARGR